MKPVSQPLSGLDEQLNKLSPEIRELLARRLDKKKEPSRQNSIPRSVIDNKNGLLPVSFAQERLWFINQLEPESPFYNTPFAYRMRGRLNQSILEKSLNEIIARHQVLHSFFVVVNERLYQKTTDNPTIKLQVIDLTYIASPDEQQIKTQELVRYETEKPFNLATGPMVRATLFKLNEEDHIFTMAIHHIVADGWSIGIFSREFAELYKANIEQKPSTLPDVSIQYYDYAAWQRQHLNGKTL